MWTIFSYLLQHSLMEFINSCKVGLFYGPDGFYDDEKLTELFR